MALQAWQKEVTPLTVWPNYVEKKGWEPGTPHWRRAVEAKVREYLPDKAGSTLVASGVGENDFHSREHHELTYEMVQYDAYREREVKVNRQLFRFCGVQLPSNCGCVHITRPQIWFSDFEKGFSNEQVIHLFTEWVAACCHEARYTYALMNGHKMVSSNRIVQVGWCWPGSDMSVLSGQMNIRSANHLYFFTALVDPQRAYQFVKKGAK